MRTLGAHEVEAAAGPVVKLVYFAWVRERIGVPGEQLVLPAELVTIADLVTWLKQKDEGYANAFADAGLIRAAIDQVHVKPDALLAGAREIAFFPPMTGG